MPVPSCALAYSATYTGESAFGSLRATSYKRVFEIQATQFVAGGGGHHLAFELVALSTFSTKDSATNQSRAFWCSPRHKLNSGFTFKAWLAGKVHAVVVQITAIGRSSV